MKRLILVLILFMVAVVACKRNESKPNERAVTKGMIAGSVLLPAASSVNANSLKVSSALSEATISGSKFNVMAYTSDISTLMISNPSGAVLLMGTFVPGDTARAISTASTALSLVLTSLSVASLSPDLQRRLLPNIRSNPEFGNLAAEVENSLIANRDLFDTTNTAIGLKIGKIVGDIFHDISTFIQENLPVDVTRNGRELTFFKEGKSFTTVIGIYKDNQKINSLTVKGVQALPASVEDFINRVGTVRYGPNIVREKYTMTGDGNFRLKMRTGLPGYEDNTEEYKEAQILNLIQAITYSMDVFLPGIDEEKVSCFRAFATDTYNAIKGLPNVTAKTAVLYALEHAYENSKTIVLCVYGNTNDFNQPFFDKLGKFFKFLRVMDRLLAPANAANLSFFVGQWIFTRAAFDTCFNVLGETVSACKDCSGTVTDVDGNTYCTVRIGTQVWMKENLKTTRYRDGTPIPNAPDAATWGSLTTGVYCNYNNDASVSDTYGRLYNWYAAANSHNIAPLGWHVPSYAEFQALVNFLGGEQPAGGRLRETGILHWQSPNSDADNSSGFTALPGGFRQAGNQYEPAIFTGLGTVGRYWTATPRPNSPDWATFLLLQNHNSTNIFYDYFKTDGHSIRCVKD